MRSAFAQQLPENGRSRPTSLSSLGAYLHEARPRRRGLPRRISLWQSLAPINDDSHLLGEHPQLGRSRTRRNCEQYQVALSLSLSLDDASCPQSTPHRPNTKASAQWPQVDLNRPPNDPTSTPHRPGSGPSPTPDRIPFLDPPGPGPASAALGTSHARLYTPPCPRDPHLVCTAACRMARPRDQACARRQRRSKIWVRPWVQCWSSFAVLTTVLDNTMRRESCQLLGGGDHIQPDGCQVWPMIEQARKQSQDWYALALADGAGDRFVSNLPAGTQVKNSC